MLVYAVIMFIMAIVFGVIAVQIYKGRTELIHDYHQTKVTDKAGYGKAFGKSMAIFGYTMALSGGIALLGDSVMWAAIAALFAGIAIGIIAIVRVQKKYNGGMFG